VQELGHAVCGIAARSEEAVQAAAELAPDIIFMDVNLGSGPDGVETAKRIRATTLVPVSLSLLTAICRRAAGSSLRFRKPRCFRSRYPLILSGKHLGAAKALPLMHPALRLERGRRAVGPARSRSGLDGRAPRGR
jgi:hypothetical protein